MKEKMLGMVGLSGRVRLGLRLAIKRAFLVKKHYVQRPLRRDKPLIVGIVSCFNHIEYTRKTIESFYAGRDARFDYVMIVIDDCSTDGTEAYFLGEARSFPNLSYYRYRWNMGLTQTWNDGARLAVKWLADYVFLINSDVVIPRGAMGFMASHLQASPVMGAISCMTNQPGHQPAQDIRRAVPGYQELDRVADIQRVHDGLTNRPVVEVEYVNGFFWGFPRMALQSNIYWKFLRTYYFNPLNRNIGNEDEFLLRMRENGLQITVAEDCFVFHYKDVSQKRFGIGP